MPRNITHIILADKTAENITSYRVMHKVMSENGGYEDCEYKKENFAEKRVWIKTNS